MTIEKLINGVEPLEEVAKINEIIDELGSGTVVTVDTELSTSSENPVQNKVITTALNAKQETLIAGEGISIEGNTITNTQTSAEWGSITGNLNSQTDLNTVLNAKQDISNLSTTISSISTDATYPSSKAVYDAIADTEYQIEVVSDLGENLVLSGGTQYDSTNFIPANTVITVKLDGSGDFTNLNDAVNYLTGKWSNGAVTIKLGAGNFVCNSKINIDTTKFNFSILYIMGDSQDGTVLSRSSWSTRWDSLTKIFGAGTSVHIHHLTVKAVRQDNVLDESCIWADSSSYVTVTDVTLQDATRGILSYSGGNIFIGNLKIINVSQGLLSQGGKLISSMDTVITASNVDTIIRVIECGIAQIARTSFNKTNVTNEFSQSVNTMTSNGVILRG